MEIIIERELQKSGNKLICGVDEVNVMSLAFGVFAGAVVMDMNQPLIEGINDSKKIPRKKIEGLALQIIKESISIGVGWSSVREADEKITDASKIAREIAVRKLLLTCNPDIIIVDYFKDKYEGVDIPIYGIKKGDQISYNIACASILAKYTYDKELEFYNKTYPEYDWIHNTGCPTKKHIEVILKCGITLQHRKKWVEHTLQNIEKRKMKNAKRNI